MAASIRLIGLIEIGYCVQLAGAAAFALGGVLSMHHVAIAAAFIGGAAVYFVGEKIREIA
jgi:hypothetical protein